MEDIKLRGTADLEGMTGIPEATWRYWRHIGYGPPSTKIGRRVYYREDEVLAWIDQKFAEENEGAA